MNVKRMKIIVDKCKPTYMEAGGGATYLKFLYVVIDSLLLRPLVYNTLFNENLHSVLSSGQKGRKPISSSSNSPWCFQKAFELLRKEEPKESM